jgi:hypothetical protein
MDYEVINIQTAAASTFIDVELSIEEGLVIVRENTRGGSILGIFPLSFFYVQYVAPK